MPRFALSTGAYTARSYIAAAQRCVNLFMEKNPEGEPFPFTCYPTPGLKQLSAGAGLSGAWRGLYTANNGVLYGVCGVSFCKILDDWSIKVLGTLNSNSGNAVEMVDNGVTLIAIDGSTFGYQLTLSDDTTFTAISQAAFYGGNNVVFSDGFFILNRPGTVQWYISTVNTATFDGTDFASKAGNMDLLVGVAVAKRYVYLFGADTTEIWVDTGGTAFPYSRLPGTFIQYGCVAPTSIAEMDGSIFWLSRSPQGEAMVLRTVEMEAVQISTFALANEITSYDTIEDAVGWTYQINGHMFYMLWFPTADKTWQFDMSNGQWNELVWVDENGVEHAHRCGAMAFAYRTHVVGDRETPVLYALDMDTYTDNGKPIKRVRGFVHGVADDFNRATYNEVILYMETGSGSTVQTADAVPLSLRWSDTGGKTWANPIMRSMGVEGEYLRQIIFQRLGASRNRVFEVTWSSPVRTSISGAFAKITPNGR